MKKTDGSKGKNKQKVMKNDWQIRKEQMERKHIK